MSELPEWDHTNRATYEKKEYKMALEEEEKRPLATKKEPKEGGKDSSLPAEIRIHMITHLQHPAPPSSSALARSPSKSSGRLNPPGEGTTFSLAGA